MSSTGRKSKRNPKDYYITPIPEIKKFLYHFNQIEPLNNKLVFDPSAGGDAQNPIMSYPEALKEYGSFVATNDIRKDSSAYLQEDYLKMNMKEYEPKPDIIMTNPPFEHAIEFIKKALQDVKPAGYVVMLTRLNFFGADCRKHFWDLNMPLYTFVHSKRMSFTGDGKVDSIEYQHMVFQEGNYPEYTQLKVI